jgi:hypothetical protein
MAQAMSMDKSFALRIPLELDDDGLDSLKMEHLS